MGFAFPTGVGDQSAPAARSGSARIGRTGPRMHLVAGALRERMRGGAVVKVLGALRWLGAVRLRALGGHATRRFRTGTWI